MIDGLEFSAVGTLANSEDFFLQPREVDRDGFCVRNVGDVLHIKQVAVNPNGLAFYFVVPKHFKLKDSVGNDDALANGVQFLGGAGKALLVDATLVKRVKCFLQALPLSASVVFEKIVVDQMAGDAEGGAEVDVITQHLHIVERHRSTVELAFNGESGVGEKPLEHIDFPLIQEHDKGADGSFVVRAPRLLIPSHFYPRKVSGF